MNLQDHTCANILKKVVEELERIWGPYSINDNNELTISTRPEFATSPCDGEHFVIKFTREKRCEINYFIDDEIAESLSILFKITDLDTVAHRIVVNAIAIVDDYDF